MRWRKISYLTGSVMLYLSFAMLTPLLWSMWEHGTDRLALSVAVSLTMAVGWLMIVTGESPGDLTMRESLVFVTLTWVMASFFSALPFIFSGAIPGFTDALFESVSGLTTTGATVLNNVEALPAGLLFWRSMTHWLGGMGIIVLFVAVYPHLGLCAGYMLQAESPGPVTQRIIPRVARTANTLWLIYIIITIAQTVILLEMGFSLFDALTHTFGTVATGGFSTKNSSIAAFNNPLAEWVIIAFMLIAGGNFALYYHVICGRVSLLFRDAEARFFLLVVLGASLLIFINIYHFQGNAGADFRSAVFQAVSMVTTTGYTTVDYNNWPTFSRMILLLLMVLGGCGGSTAGAVKQIRILVVAKFMLRELKKTTRPDVVVPLNIGGYRISEQSVQQILAFLGLYAVLLVSAALYLTYLGIDPVTAISAAVATQGNVGPGLGAVGPSFSYAPLPGSAKLLLSFLMLAGRLEIYTVLALLIPEDRFRIRLGRGM
jgi:trk system potassium uptake protein TrkH